MSDPTCTFQSCPACGGQPRLRVRRYECPICGADVPSRFVFDGLVFDADYFRQRMAEHREKAQKRLDRVRRMLAESRSPAIPLQAAALESVPGLMDALDRLTSGTFEVLPLEGKAKFDLRAYQRHIEAQIGATSVGFDEIAPLAEDHRLDRVWRFIAIIFLAHDGRIEIIQEGAEIMVMQRETDREGQDVSGELEEADGVEGLVG